jgi:hypothetical protein
MDAVNLEVLNAIEEEVSIRIVVDVPTNLVNLSDPLSAATDLVTPFITLWSTKHDTRLLAVDLYPRHTYVVVDINNHRYDYDTAHAQLYTIPVYILQLSKGGKWSFFRRSVDDKRVAKEIATLHRCNGWDKTPPFLADHIQGSVYLSPRST